MLRPATIIDLGVADRLCWRNPKFLGEPRFHHVGTIVWGASIRVLSDAAEKPA